MSESTSTTPASISQPSTNQNEYLGTSEQLTIEKKLANARNTAQFLYLEIEKTKRRYQDSTLKQATTNIPSLNNQQVQLRLHATLRGHADKVADICWSSDLESIISVSQDGLMLQWNSVTGYKRRVIPLKNPWVLTCATSKDSKYFASAGLDNSCTIYYNSFTNGNLTNGSSVKAVFKGHTAYISSCEFNSNSTIITGSGDMTCGLWDCNKGSKIRSFVDHLGDVLCLSVNSKNDDPNIFVSGASDGYAKVWDLRQSNEVQNFYTAAHDINCVKMFPAGNSFITGSDDGILRLYDMRSDCQLASFDLQKEVKSFLSQYSSRMSNEGNSITNSIRNSFTTTGISSVDFSRSGRLVFACYDDIGCIIWDLLKGEAVGMLGNGNSRNHINQVRVSKDGLAVATTSRDSTIGIWTI